MLPTDKKARKETPIYSGVLAYFPDAIAEVARVSYEGNKQHNGPDAPLHWDRMKSTDHLDCISRHMLDHGSVDDDGMLHSAKLAWRALALLQTEIEDAEVEKSYFPMPDTGGFPVNNDHIDLYQQQYRRKAYLSGPMRGIKDFNFPSFDYAKEVLTGDYGYDVISPADLDRKEGFNEKADPHLPLDQTGFVKRDVEALLSLGKDGLVVMLPGWENSTGATAEFHIAQWLGLEVKEWDEI